MLALVVLPLVWAGMVLGISFLETPVKFTVPSVTTAIGLDIGRHVFRVLNRVELCFGVAACVLMLVYRTPIVAARTAASAWMPLLAAVLVVVAQAVWLLPCLDARAQLVMAGQTPPRGAQHAIFIALELMKVVCLIAAGLAYLSILKSAAPGVS